MKKLMFFLIFICIFSFSAKAQYYNYTNPYQQNVIIQTQDLGTYGYGALQNEIMRFGYFVGPNRYQQSLRSSMILLGRQTMVNKIRNLQITPQGSYVWTDLYLNGIYIGRTNVVGRMATTTLYRQSLERAMYPQMYYYR